MLSLDFSGDAESQQLSLLRIDASLALAGSIAPIGARAAVPAPGSVACVLIVVLAKAAGFAFEVAWEVWCQVWHQVVDEEIVVDLGIGAAIPAGTLIVLGDAELLRPRGVVADRVSTQVNEESAELFHGQRFDD